MASEVAHYIRMYDCEIFSASSMLLKYDFTFVPNSLGKSGPPGPTVFFRKNGLDRASVMSALVFDPDLITELDQSIGLQGRNALLLELADWTEQVRGALHRLIGIDDLRGARQEAHSLRTAASRVGAFRLVDCLLQVELYVGAHFSEAIFDSRLAGAVEEFVQQARSVAGQSIVISSPMATVNTSRSVDKTT